MLHKLKNARFYTTTGAASSLNDSVDHFYQTGEWTERKSERAVINLCKKLKKYGHHLTIDDLKNDKFVIGVDIGEGLEEDYSTLKIRKVVYNKQTKRLNYKLIGIFHDNTYSVQDFAKNLVKFLMTEVDTDNIKLIVENNNYGAELFLTIEMMKMSGEDLFDEFCIAQFYRASKEDFEKGIRWNKENKKTAVRNYKTFITTQEFDDTHPESINESMNFGRFKNGTYAAQYGHDDLVMADITIAYYIKNQTYDSFIKDCLVELKPLTEKEIIEKERKENKWNYEHNGFQLKKHTNKNKNSIMQEKLKKRYKMDN